MGATFLDLHGGEGFSMKDVDNTKLRNVSLVGHGGCGKTSIAEMILFATEMTERLGKVEEGNTVSDFDPEEMERGNSISASLLYTHHREFKINLLDTPGYADFVGELYAGIRAVDGVLLVLNSEMGVEVQTETAWRLAQERGLPGIVVVNRMDKERADFERCLEAVGDSLGVRAIPLFAPIGEGEHFNGVVDILTGKSYIYAADGTRSVEEKEIPAEMEERVASLKEAFVEAVAETDDALLEKFFEEELSEEEVKSAMAKGVREGVLLPAIPSCATKNVGAAQILDLVCDYLPSPMAGPALQAVDSKEEAVEIARSPEDPFCGLVFKTVADPYAGKLSYIRGFSGQLSSDSTVVNANRDNKERIGSLLSLQGKNQKQKAVLGCGDIAVVAKLANTQTGDTLCEASRKVVLPACEYPEGMISLAISPKTRGDEEKLTTATARLIEEDPTFKMERNVETGETLIHGMGDLHLDVVLAKLKRKFGLEVEKGTPKVAFRETIKKSVEAQGRYKKQTGGRGQFGDVWIRLEPKARGEGFEFEDAIVGGVVPKNYIPAVEKGIVEAMSRGVLAGFPVVDLKVTLYDGSYHSVDSSDLAFKIAGSMAFQKAAHEAGLYLVEPIMEVDVVAPDENMGDIIGDLNGRRGKILGVEPTGTLQKVSALVPLQEMFTYSSTLRSITSGRGSYVMRFSTYEEVPHDISKKIVAQAEAAEEEG